MSKPTKTPRVPENQPLSENEKEIMAEMKTKYAEELKALAPISDMTMIRYIRGYKDDVKPRDKAVDMFGAMLKWRAENNVDKLSTMTLPKTELYSTMWQSGYHGTGKDGHPVYIDRLGAVEPSKLLKEFTFDDLLKFHIQMLERGTAARDAASRPDRVRYKQIVILDLKGLGFAHAGGQFREPMGKFINIDQHMYPETLYVMIIVNAGIIVKTIWAIASGFVDPITKENIKWNNDALLEYIDINQIPRMYGGKCACEGGKCLLVPFKAGTDNTITK